MKTNNDADTWGRAVNAARKEYAALPVPVLGKIRILLANIKKLKTALYELNKSVEGEAVCALCLGDCCASGKYHFTVTDLLVYISDANELFVPDFSSKHCPYLGENGCIMEPEYRPFNCITFNCERIERLLLHSDVQKFYGIERKLRIQYNAVEEIFGNKFVYGLLSNFERNYLKNGTILFGGRYGSYIYGGLNGNDMQ
jgi:hypothetical protein